jgi:hypothetical protein
VLDLPLDAFRTGQVTLVVRVPSMDLAHYLTGDGVDRVRLADRAHGFLQQVTTVTRLGEAYELRLPDHPTVGALIEAIQGRVVGWLPTADR